MTFDGKAFGAEIVGVVKGYLQKEMSPVLARLDALEKSIEAAPALAELKAELDAVKSAVEAIDIPEASPGQELPDIAAMVMEAVAALPVPQDGKSVTVEEVAPLIASEVESCISKLPRAKDGRDGLDGKDGISLAGAFIDRDGNLAVTLSNGEVKNLGPVVGRDGDPGKDGEDGVGFDDMNVTYDGAKTISLAFTKGERVKRFEFCMPVVIDRGVYREDGNYKAGDGATFGGSYWIAQKDTSSKPGVSDDWRLAVKKGRDGKDGSAKEVQQPQPVRVGIPAGKN